MQQNLLILMSHLIQRIKIENYVSHPYMVFAFSILSDTCFYDMVGRGPQISVHTLLQKDSVAKTKQLVDRQHYDPVA